MPFVLPIVDWSYEILRLHRDPGTFIKLWRDLQEARDSSWQQVGLELRWVMHDDVVPSRGFVGDSGETSEHTAISGSILLDPLDNCSFEYTQNIF